MAQSGPPLNRDPEMVKFVTSDIGNFWRAYDLAAKETDKAKRVAIFQTEYLDKGSPGLKDFLRLRIKSALGCYVGYLITQAYYRNAKDKRQAVHDILNIQDARAFYEASGVRKNTVGDKR
jgi:hypothetical protein